MPQLNPTPWFTILVFSWVLLLVILPPKILTFILPNDPTPQNIQKPKMEAWNWPWY
uniref:ATP synthase complex subunit 8 n=1 Tax=Maccullochella macquariensis TaxID=135760 RepID=A0A0N7G5K8_9TELE|nr:ATPase subunit 8 [Maccullochella macquariensis]ALH16711.1 ATPase subunit 8 [Maccullochella macquariensis]ALH16737.1 ATPase subunit 8 [Maccullochella macquariensis]ALH16750.1 ATPase subunit 8 [Maccullochella macquariensis]ALH16763.1 ATPase subunit 8 [Maccullochella macquariensis]